jgi:hypothetical protein
MVGVCRILSIAPPNACSPFSQSYGNSNSNGYGGYHSNNHGGGGYGGGWGGDRNGDGLGGSLRNIDWSQQKSIPFEKNFYVEDKRVSSRSDREIEEFRRLKEIKVRSSQSCPATLSSRTFVRCKGTPCPARLPHSLKLASPNISWFLLKLKAFRSLLLFSARLGRWHSQEEMLWPSHRLVVGRLLPSPFLPCSISMRKCFVARCSSESHFYYYHPLRQALLSPGDGPIALVLAPTRELAVQIQQECTKFGYVDVLAMLCIVMLTLIVRTHAFVILRSMAVPQRDRRFAISSVVLRLPLLRRVASSTCWNPKRRTFAASRTSFSMRQTVC